MQSGLLICPVLWLRRFKGDGDCRRPLSNFAHLESYSGSGVRNHKLDGPFLCAVAIHKLVKIILWGLRYAVNQQAEGSRFSPLKILTW